jgi:2-polyprenyl-3-methyl-5-hydroxy-6-metoxy-1,4-benzoquinol methylase
MEAWQTVRDVIGDRRLTLGPYFAQQALEAPRHLLFTLSRYKFAARLLPPAEQQLRVLELGCGEGFGTLMLAESQHDVTGLDFDQQAIEHAQRTLGKVNLRFVAGDIIAANLGVFDVVVSLDTIEHIPRSAEQEYVSTVTRHLSEHGFCVVGTPNKTASQYASPASQVGHVNLYTAERLFTLFSESFRNVFLFGMNDEVVHTGFYPMCHYLFVLACGKRTPPP